MLIPDWVLRLDPQNDTPKPRGTRLDINIGTSMMVNRQDSEKGLKCNFVGLDQDRILVLSLPGLAAESAGLLENTPVTVRYLSSGRIFGFYSQVLGHFRNSNLRYLFLSYPETVETHNLRQDTRVDCYLPAKAVFREQEVGGVVRDLSQGGMRFVSTEMLRDDLPDPAPHEELVVVCQFLGREGPQKVPCQVRNVNLDGTMVSLGLAFLDLEPSLAEGIKSYIQEVSVFLESKD